MPSSVPFPRSAHVFSASVAVALGLSACADYEVPALKKLQGDQKTDIVSVAASNNSTATPAPVTPGKPKEDLPVGNGAKLSKEDLELMRKRAQMNASAIAMERDLAKAAQSSGVDLSFLLSMNYNEAKAISANSIEMPMGVRIAADKIEIVKQDSKGVPRRVKATGKVYLENGQGDDMAKVLCQEALVSSGEIVLRGKPILQRGGSTIEGLDDSTVAYMLGQRLRVIGLHRVANQTTMIADLPDLGPWTGGPNPLLPPLSEASVPNDIRDQMLKAAEAEAVLQQNREAALSTPQPPVAPWVKPEANTPANKEDIKPVSTKPDPKAAKEDVKPALLKPVSKDKVEEAPPAPKEEPKKGKTKKEDAKAPEKPANTPAEAPAEKPKRKFGIKFGNKKD
ncbi:hypothetical protein [Brevifollis gellanilyticus]|uniref:Uncharacterized protein n=1 Tax=Brevifollis gellanilyticus TaxID=748831 RepID=A0A512MB40_9BACT|nr:hypothetical protein [Brevifollis gellanilyticus]GEP43955.1 hypothetical protein BGE01nite_32460 [Brevifollis gellanilyticus]